MSFGEAISSVLGNYITFDGRARRREYWYWALAIIVAYIVVGAIFAASHSVGIILYIVVTLGIILPSIAVAIRRLHDTDRTGWWILLSFVPFGSLVLLVFYLLDGTPGENQYGPSPKGLLALPQ